MHTIRICTYLKMSLTYLHVSKNVNHTYHQYSQRCHERIRTYLKTSSIHIIRIRTYLKTSLTYLHISKNITNTYHHSSKDATNIQNVSQDNNDGLLPQHRHCRCVCVCVCRCQSPLLVTSYLQYMLWIGEVFRYVRIHIYMYIYIYVYTLPTHACMYVYVHVHTTLTHTHIYIYTRTHICI